MKHINHEEFARTDDLIRRLSNQAGMKDRATMYFDHLLWANLALSLAFASLIVISLSGVRPDLSEVLTTWMFQYKVAGMALLTCGSVILLRSAGTPGIAARPFLVLFPGFLFLVAGVLVDNSGFALLGERKLSIALCVGVIVVASLPALATFIAVLRRGIPTRLTSAGAISGLLSGSLSALAYTIACMNDAALFVAIWYSVAISITTVIGAIVGRYALAW